MINRIIEALNESGITADIEALETILNGNGTPADGTREDLIETLRNYTNASEELINSI